MAGRASYFERQMARWSQQYLEDAAAGRDPDMDRLVEWLPDHIPRVTRPRSSMATSASTT
jgi:aminoglycoside phosphotransferase (APT) family kinase protein